MVWFWSKTPKADDGLDSLDPSLRDFFDKSTAPKQDGSGANAPPPPPSEEVKEEQKGLWSTYNPPKSEEPAPQEVLISILAKYKTRQASINDAALINCAFEQERLHNCYINGTWREKLGLCRDQSREFEGCLESQMAVLKEIGFEGDGSELDRNRQAYADRIYREERDALMKEKELKASDAAEKLAERAQAAREAKMKAAQERSLE
ncbi:hypothetical protein BJ508DRAFT_178314 [Ascobolus immersus RN42]|uniref:Uncharacterized protein n=1 Tax=Ascobolus immersus RN42 TaxID=1160509 RepID=A0A3N4IMY7_ASCIM|nr:hypothetical protein BJ508DRAFT_178314 [Ascobolus immersus RN42]